MNTDKQSGLEKLSGTAKAIWGLITIVVSAATAVASAAIYFNNLRHDMDEVKQQMSAVKQQMDTMFQQLKVVSPIIVKGADFNGNSTPLCDSGSFMTGLRIGVDGNGNPHGDIRCAKVQPAIQ